MTNFDELSADQILEKVMADGVVDADEVRALDCKLKQDWVVDRGEIELLFRVNKSLGERSDTCDEWTSFFVDNVSRLLIMDLDTPGEIDEAEGDWLADVLDQHSVGNTTELALIDALRKGTSRIAGRITQRV